MSEPINLTPSGPPETVLPEVSAGAAAALSQALAADPGPRKGAVAAVVAAHPRFVEAWARLGESADDPVEAYAYFRVGYHRGLDALRGAGWRGSGYVRWQHVSNQGFLRALAGLHRMAGVIGEQDEVDRIAQFLIQLDPDWPVGSGMDDSAPGG
jgi:hypothetical protein